VTPTAKTEGSIEVFCSYSHKDEALREEFDTHVAMLKRRLVQVWHDRNISAGGEWAGEIDEHLNSADIITLFVSADFLNSEYCYDKEVTRAMVRQSQKEAVVVPIIVRPCDWKDAPFGSLQAIPTDGKPVTKWSNRDEAWTDVVLKLKITVMEVLQRVQARLKEQIKSEPGSVSLDTVGAQGYRDAIAFFKPEEAQRARQQMLRWQILQDTQKKIFEIQQEVTARAGASKDHKFRAWDKYIQQA
jgi:hypothetical protein